MAVTEGGIWVPARTLDEWKAEDEVKYQQTLDRVAQGKDTVGKGGSRIDPYDVREYKRDVVAGRDRKIDTWNQVMEWWRFVWFEPQQLDQYVGKMQVYPSGLPGGTGVYVEQSHTEGQWRNDWTRVSGGELRRRHKPLPYAAGFTPNDLIGNFPGGPADWDRWWRQERVKYATRRLGLT